MFVDFRSLSKANGGRECGERGETPKWEKKGQPDEIIPRLATG